MHRPSLQPYLHRFPLPTHTCTQISKVCLQVIKPETPVVLELISKDFSLATVTDWELDKSHWINVIAQLQLTDPQVMGGGVLPTHQKSLLVAAMWLSTLTKSHTDPPPRSLRSRRSSSRASSTSRR